MELKPEHLGYLYVVSEAIKALFAKVIAQREQFKILYQVAERLKEVALTMKEVALLLRGLFDEFKTIRQELTELRAELGLKEPKDEDMEVS